MLRVLDTKRDGCWLKDERLIRMDLGLSWTWFWTNTELNRAVFGLSWTRFGLNLS